MVCLFTGESEVVMEDQGQCEEVLKAVNEESALVLLHAQ